MFAPPRHRHSLLECWGHVSRKVLALAACTLAAAGAPVAAAPDIALGVIVESSGAGASYGQGMRQGAEMAVRDLNAAGGIAGRKIRLVIADGGTNPARSAIAMRRLVAAGVDVVVGGWGSPQVLANMDITEQAAVPYIVVGATHPRITSASNRWTFRVIQTDAVMAEQLAQVVLGTLGARRIAVINDSNDYGVGNRDVFIAALRKAGAAPVEVQSYENTDTEFGPQLARIQASEPDAVAVFGTVPAAPAIMRQARTLGITARFVGTGGLANDVLMALAAGAAEGTVLMTHFNEEVDAESQAWADRYRRDLAGSPEAPRPVLAAWEYRAIHGIVAPCLARVGTDRVALRECIAGWRGRLFGVGGEAAFDKTGQLVQPPLVVEVRNGAFRLLRAAR